MMKMMMMMMVMVMMLMVMTITMMNIKMVEFIGAGDQLPRVRRPARSYQLAGSH